MLKDIRKFLLQGDVVAIAVGLVIALNIKAVIDSLVNSIIMPIVGIVGGKPSFDEYTITLNDSIIRWGTFATDVVNFVIVGLALFVVVQVWEKMKNVMSNADAAPDTELSLLTEIRDSLRTKS